MLFIFLICSASGSFVHAQSNSPRTITGVVSDQSGSTLPGASVLVKGTKISALTNSTGVFTINVPSGSNVLTVSYIGMTSQDVVIGEQKNLKVALQETSSKLNEVVVVGYGTVRRADVTSSISSVTEKDIKNLPVAGIDQALQGKVAGVSISTNGGQPGGGVSVRVRGVTSVSGGAGNEPLYVVDGVPLSTSPSANYSAGGAGAAQTSQSPLATINPADIASIDILKDASAQAIYGSRAANGVIIITTKRGRAGESKILYDVFYGQAQIQKKIDMMDLKQFAQYQNQILQEIALVNGNEYNPIGEYADPSVLGKGTDWQDALFQNGITQQHQLAFSGASNKTTYYTSANYFSQTGVVTGSGLKRYSARVNLDQQVKDWAKVGITANLIRSNQRVSLTNGSATPISVAVGNSPAAPIYLNGGFAPSVNVGGYNFGIDSNPLALASLRDVRVIQSKALANLYAEITINKHITLRSQFGVDYTVNQNTFFQPQVSNGAASIISRSQINESRGLSLFWNVTNYANYNQSFGKHNVTAQIGQEAWESSSDQLNGNRYDLNLNFPSIGAGSATGETTGGGIYDSGMSSYFGRAGYSFDNRYSLNLSVRRDGSSTFGPEKRFGYFPAASLGWTVTNEAFAKDLKTLNYLKIRLGAGAVGGTGGGGANAFTAGLIQQTGAFGPGSWPKNVPNPRLAWMSVKTYNGGVDATILNKKIEISVDLYKKVTTDMLLPSALPYYSGIGTNYNDIQSPITNAGKMTNTGIDLAITSYNISNDDFSWKTQLNFSHYKNILNELNAGTSELIFRATDALNVDRVVTRSVIGQPVGQFYGFLVDGIFGSEQEIKNSPYQGIAVTPKGTWIGDIKYKDISGPNGVPDGIIDSFDQTFIGNPNPKFTFGFTNNFNYKSFDLSIFLQGSYGAKILNFTKLLTEGSYNSYNNQSANVLNNRFSASNPNGTLPRYNEWHENNRRLSDRFIEDGSYIRLQTVSLGYNLPTKLINKAKIASARIYLSGQNIYTLTNYSGYDPELGSFNNNALFSNVDNGNYPNPRTYTIGANITF